MPQADSVHSTPSTNTSPFPPIARNDVARLESPLCEVAHMAAVNSSVLEASLSVPAQIREGHVFITDQEAEELLFCAFHLERMIKAFKEQYYAALAGKAVA
jgi:hypothetical protein